ncbi:hypothetical protein JCM9957A_65120 [Kineosporia succinea]
MLLLLPPHGQGYFAKASVTFRDGGTWDGADGCHRFGGTYTASAGGGFRATASTLTSSTGRWSGPISADKSGRSG